MSNYDVFMKLKDRVTHISYNDLLHSIIANPVGILRSFNNLNTILESDEINKFNDPTELLLFIEKKSRELDVSKARLIQAKIKKEYEEKLLIETEKNRKKEELLKSILKSQGLDGNRDVCISCGFVPVANGNCKC